MDDGTTFSPRLVTPLPRRIGGGSASFGVLGFGFKQAVRRADERVIVEIDLAPGVPPLLSIFESAARLGVAQLCLGATTCRARAVDWDQHVRAIVFELSRAGEPEPAILNAA